MAAAMPSSRPISINLAIASVDGNWVSMIMLLDGDEPEPESTTVDTGVVTP